MQELLVGEIIKQRRIEQGLTQEELCEGICDPVTISRIENVKQPPSRSTADALLQRLGISDSRYYFTFCGDIGDDSVEDIESVHQVERLLASVERSCGAGAEATAAGKERLLKTFAELESLTCRKDPLEKQRVLIAKVRVLENLNSAVTERIQLLEEAILLTVPKFQEQHLAAGVYGYDEMDMIRRLGLAYADAGQTKRAVQLLSQLYDHVTARAGNINRPGRVISPVAHSYGTALMRDQKPQQALAIAEYGIQNCIFGYDGELVSLLELEAECLMALEMPDQGKEKALQASTLRRLTEKFSGQSIQEEQEDINQSILHELSCAESKNMHLGKVIKHVRERRGFSQKQLCQGLCTVATLSRFESGEQSPSWDCVHAMLERLGMAQDEYTAILTADELHLDKMKKEIMKLGVMHEREKAEHKHDILNTLLNMIDDMESKIKKTDIINRQFIMRQRALIAYETHTCDLDERLNRLTAALHMTLPNLSFEDMHQMLYTEEEFSLLINIARTYHKLGQVRQSFYIYEQLYRVFKRNYYHHDLMIFFAQSYAIALSNEKADEDVIRVADDGIAIAIEKKQYEVLPILLHVQAECFYLLGQTDKCREYYAYIAPLYRLFGDYRNLEILSIDAEERFSMKF